MAKPVYLDNAATTPLDPTVGEAMRPWVGWTFGNPSSLHATGRVARQAVDVARQQVADLLGGDPGEIVFTGSGTEADNVALVGVAETFAPGDFHLVTSAIEHPAVLATCDYLTRRGIEVSYLPASGEGIVEADTLRSSLRPSTRLVSVMAVNNVVGTVQPIADLARIAHDHGALFHTDAVQAVGKLPLNVHAQSIDLLSLSSHKLNGPQGVGALYIRNGIAIEPLIHGGGQESGLRSGTENVAGLVGFGRAAELARATLAEENARLSALGERILTGLESRVPNTYLFGDRYRRLPSHLCLGFRGQEGEAIRLLLALDQQGIAASAGSACSASHAGEPSSVLVAMGFDPIRARGSLRLTLGRFNTDADVDRLLDVLPEAVESLRPITSHQTPALTD
ncbi:MAG: cysteine desulfurase family protein [Solirubrobacteraceae bacterium]